MSLSGLSFDSQRRTYLIGSTLFALGSIVWASVNPLVKVLSRTVPIEQILWVRFAGHLLFAMACFLPREGLAAWRSYRPTIQFLRSMFLLALASANFLAVSRLPVAHAVAIMFTFPFFVCLLAGPLLGERVRPREWCTVTVGFLGVLAIVKPGTAPLTLGVAFAVASALLFALVQLSTRRLGTVDSAVTTQLYTALVGTVVLAPIAYGGWRPATAHEWLLLVGTAGCTAIGIYLVILGQTYVPAAHVAPLAYLQVVTCVLYDIAVFGVPLDWLTMVGMIAVVGAGAYTSAPQGAAARSTSSRATGPRGTHRAPGLPGLSKPL
jgi:drug/metabolite transporter (DMT)-like permease